MSNVLSNVEETILHINILVQQKIYIHMYKWVNTHKYLHMYFYIQICITVTLLETLIKNFTEFQTKRILQVYTFSVCTSMDLGKYYMFKLIVRYILKTCSFTNVHALQNKTV